MESSCEEYNSCVFVCMSYNGSYRSLNTTLYNEHILKKDAYPKTFQMELKFLVHFQTLCNVPRCTVPYQEKVGVNFFQRGKSPEAKVKVKTNRQGKSEFFHCGNFPISKNQFPYLTQEQNDELVELRGANLLNFAKESDGEAYIDKESEEGVALFYTKTNEKRDTLDPNKLYINSYATYHLTLVYFCLNNTHKVSAVLK